MNADSKDIIFGYRIAGPDMYALLDELDDHLPPPGGQLDFRFTKLEKATRPKCLSGATVPREKLMQGYFGGALELHVGTSYIAS